MAPFDVYQKHLSFLSQGFALWSPNPLGSIYDRVSIGDVGYIDEGAFVRMFNVILPWDDPSNRNFGQPDEYEPLQFHGNAIRRTTFDAKDHCSSSVFRGEYANSALATSPEPAGRITYRCRGIGALLSLPDGGHNEDAITTGVFQKYIQNNVNNWFSWAQKNGLGVQRMEDLILVSGCTLVTSWAAAAFVDHTINAEISLERRTLSNGGTDLVWSNIQGPVVYHNSRFDPQNTTVAQNQCVFIRGFRAKRLFFRTRVLRAAAEPRPDDPDNRRDDEVQMKRVPGVPKYRDPLIEVLDYIVEDTIAEEAIAIAHENDLQLIQEVEILTADTIENVLRDEQMPLFVVDAAILRDPLDIEPQVSDEKKAAFYAAAECIPRAYRQNIFSNSR